MSSFDLDDMKKRASYLGLLAKRIYELKDVGLESVEFSIEVSNPSTENARVYLTLDHKKPVISFAPEPMKDDGDVPVLLDPCTAYNELGSLFVSSRYNPNYTSSIGLYNERGFIDTTPCLKSPLEDDELFQYSVTLDAEVMKYMLYEEVLSRTIQDNNLYTNVNSKLFDKIPYEVLDRIVGVLYAE